MKVASESAPNLAQIATIRHGFFTRAGGCSDAPYDAMNCSLYVGDSVSHVTRNRTLALAGLGLKDTPLFIPKLVHGNTVVVVDRHMSPDELSQTHADAVITTVQKRALAVTYADCVPILLAATDGSIVAAIHSGWRGVRERIVDATIDATEQTVGKKALVAAVGPCISPLAFTVTDDVREYFLAEHRSFVSDDGSTAHVDLRAIVLQQLLSRGVTDVAMVGGHTDLEPAKYFSHRVSKPPTGRNMALIAIL